MKKSLLVIGTTIVLTISSSAFVYGTNINVNGADITFTNVTGYPYVDANNRTQVPLRVTMEQAGATVSWDAASKVATVEKQGIVVQVPIGANYIIVDGEQVKTDTAAVIRDGRTYLPIRPVLEAVNFSVEWDNDTQTVLAANYYDYVADQEMVVAEKRQNIKNSADLLDYLLSDYRLQQDKDIAIKMAERDYLDKFSKDTGPMKVVSSFEWYTEDQLEDAGITLDDSSFTCKRDADFTKCTFEGELVLEGKNKTVTIDVPKFTIPISYNDDDDNTDSNYKDNEARTYDGVRIFFSPWTIEFNGADLVSLGLIN